MEGNHSRSFHGTSFLFVSLRSVFWGYTQILTWARVSWNRAAHLIFQSSLRKQCHWRMVDHRMSSHGCRDVQFRAEVLGFCLHVLFPFFSRLFLFLNKFCFSPAGCESVPWFVGTSLRAKHHEVESSSDRTFALRRQDGVGEGIATYYLAVTKIRSACARFWRHTCIYSLRLDLDYSVRMAEIKIRVPPSSLSVQEHPTTVQELKPGRYSAFISSLRPSPPLVQKVSSSLEPGSLSGNLLLLHPLALFQFACQLKNNCSCHQQDFAAYSLLVAFIHRTENLSNAGTHIVHSRHKISWHVPGCIFCKYWRMWQCSWQRRSSVPSFWCSPDVVPPW